MQIKKTGITNGSIAAKVLFFPHYFYLSYAPFRRIIASLNCREVEGYIVYMHCKSFDESNQFPLERLKNDRCPFKQLPFVSIGRKGTSLLVKFTRFFEFIINYRGIKHYLQAQQPALVVVESDLGGIYIRFILDTCRHMHVPVLIILPIDFGSARCDANSNSNREARVPTLARLFLRLFGIERLVLFKGSLIGSYFNEAKILVASKAMKNQLVRSGICQERLFVTGIPRYDDLYQLLRAPVGAVKSDICRDLGWNISCKIVVYFTQLIHRLYGTDYMDRVNKLLAHAFEDLPAECRIVIKLHPREDADYSKIFIGNRYQIIRDIDVDRLLRAADLVVSHLSSTLSDAALLGTPLLSINILNDQPRMMFDSSQELVQINSEAAFTKIYGMLYNTILRDRARVSIERWIKENVTAVDGHSSERIADFIKHFIMDEGRQEP